MYTDWFNKQFLNLLTMRLVKAPSYCFKMVLQHMGTALIDSAIANNVILVCFPPMQKRKTKKKIFPNIRGITDKLQNKQLCEYICQHDIVCLVESMLDSQKTIHFSLKKYFLFII